MDSIDIVSIQKGLMYDIGHDDIILQIGLTSKIGVAA